MSKATTKRKTRSRKPGRRNRNRKRHRDQGHGVHGDTQPGESPGVVQLGDRSEQRDDQVGLSEQPERVRLSKELVDKQRDLPEVQRGQRETNGVPTVKELLTLKDVQLMGLTTEKIKALWDKLEESGQADKSVKDPFGSFTNLLIDPRTVIYEIPDLRAVFYFADVTPGGNSNVHILVWDKALLGNRQLYIDINKETMGIFNLSRVTAMIPEWNKASQNLVVKMGMKKEGTLRNWGDREGIKHDVHIFGLLREELS
jgi:hypothetical protein